jgi:hypothetical protein
MRKMQASGTQTQGFQIAFSGGLTGEPFILYNALLNA